MTPSHFEHELSRAYAAIGDGKPVVALAIADQLQKVRTDDPRVWDITARASLLSGNDKEAFDAARKVVEFLPAVPECHILLAEIAWRWQRLSDAQRAFEQAVEFSGRRTSYLNDYAWFLALERGGTVTEKACREALKADVESADAWAALGMMQYRTLQWKDARRSLARALECDSENLRAQWAMTILLQESGSRNQATGLARLMEINPEMRPFSESVKRRARLEDSLAREEVQRSVLDHTFPEAKKWPGILAGVLVVLFLFALPFGDGWRMFCTIAAMAMARFLWQLYHD